MRGEHGACREYQSNPRNGHVGHARFSDTATGMSSSLAGGPFCQWPRVSLGCCTTPRGQQRRHSSRLRRSQPASDPNPRQLSPVTPASRLKCKLPPAHCQWHDGSPVEYRVPLPPGGPARPRAPLPGRRRRAAATRLSMVTAGMYRGADGVGDGDELMASRCAYAAVIT